MHHPEFPIVSFLCVPLLLASLPSHIRARNISTLSLLAWLIIMSIIRGVNSIAWAGNVDIKLLVWCDITTKITVGFTYAVPASALCILRHLEAVASTRYATSGMEDKRRRQIFETIMCFGLPIIFMALHYVVQGHRFDIAEDLGCAPAVYISLAAVFILWFPPLLLSTISMIYAVLSLRHFLRHRISFATHLQNSHSTISAARYFRLMALAIVEIVWDAGTNIYILNFNINSGLRPWISWADVHSNFSRVGQFPNFLVPEWIIENFIFQWWIIPLSCFFFFIFFGTGEEAMSNYRAVSSWIWRSITRCTTFRSNNAETLLPSFTMIPDTPTTHRKLSVTQKRSSGCSTLQTTPTLRHSDVYEDITASKCVDTSPENGDSIELPSQDTCHSYIEQSTSSARQSFIHTSHDNDNFGVTDQRRCFYSHPAPCFCPVSSPLPLSSSSLSLTHSSISYVSA